ncbi:UbiA-like protein EboC [Aureicoccus marinus]|uniref:Ubiquinone biosynthesis protein UbiA n=1 Tax=Aureicoccus marinus TaxID=754435 RepID=A0A2S7T683_9FLAO|nr:UbiA-like protein EboC [Aureicoccus marinus]PQJ15429.1 hypothetical protein BST99_06495 [Aureicoccus marinus]
MNPTLKAYIQLCRPANLPTAAADILAGAAIMAGVPATQPHYFTDLGERVSLMHIPPFGHFLAIVFSSILLYAGGVVLNDFFDSDLDAKERPERPIPSGKVGRFSVLWFGSFLLFFGVILSFLMSPRSGYIAFLLAGMIVLYNWKAKHHTIAGPIAMGSCRALNLMLGMSYYTSYGIKPIYLLIPLLYIGAVTSISQGEVHGGRKGTQAFAAFLYAVVGILILYLAYEAQGNWQLTVGVLVLFYYLVGKPLYKAWKEPKAENIRKAVKWGVMSLIVLDAAIASGYATPWITLIILALFPLSRTLSKVFAVT